MSTHSNSNPTQPDDSRLQSADRREMLRGAGLMAGGAIATGLVPGALGGAMAAPRGGDIVAMDAMELSQRIKSKQVSCVEVMDAYLTQVKRVNPTVNAIVSLQDEGKLREQAAERDRMLARGHYMGWMHGMPQAPKDTASTAGIPTTQGSPILKDYIPKEDAIIIERARRAGAIVIGKTNVPEFALGSNTVNPVFGNTVNPFNLAKTVGGSSGGAAAALVARMLPVADGSDMGGSIRNPSAFCNVYGLRSTAGVVPFGPSPEVFIQQFAIEGPMGRTVKDVAMLLSTQAGFDKRVPLSVQLDPKQFTAKLESNVKGKRIAWLGDWNGYFAMEPGVLELCQAQLKTFSDLGCIVEPVAPMFDPAVLWKMWLTHRQFIIGNYLRLFYDNPKLRPLLKTDAQWEVEQSLKLTGADVFASTVERSAWVQALNVFFEKYDFILSPTAQVFPFDVKTLWPKTVGGRTMETYHQWMGIVLPWTLAGTPIMNIPVGFGPGMTPMGMQLIGPRHADFKVLQMARAYELATGFVQKNVPPIARA
jgi:amidase